MIKKAYTLAETLIVLGIISILLYVGLSYLKQQETRIKYLYGNTYYYLDRAFYNAVETTSYDPFDSKYTHSSTKDEGTEALCKGLAEYINVDESKKKCSATKFISGNAADSEFTNDKVQLETAQGLRFFFSNKIDDTFYLIFVDMNNNDSSPNSICYYKECNDANGKQNTDIFTFAALSTGRVIPVGIAELKTEFMQTRVTYPEERDDELVLRYSHATLPYYQSKAVAWGYYTGKNGAPTAATAITNYSPEEPYTWNDFVRSKIKEKYPNSNILKGYSESDFAIADSDKKHQLNEGKEPTEEPFCKAVDYDTCGVNIDRYQY